MTYLIDSSPIISSICLIILSLSNRTKQIRLNVLSALIFTSLAIVSLYTNSFFDKNDDIFYYTTILNNIILLLFFPLVNVYITIYTQERITKKKIVLWMFPLFICIGLITAYSFFKEEDVINYFRAMISNHEVITNSHDIWLLHLVTWKYFNWYFAAISLVFLVDSCQAIYSFRQKVKKANSTWPNPVDFINYSVLYVLVISSTLLFIVFALFHLDVSKISAIHPWRNLISTLVIIYLGHHMLRQNKKYRVYQLYLKDTGSNASTVQIHHKESQDEETLIESIEAIHEMLNQHIMSDTLFLNPKLTVADLSATLGIKQTCLSKYFNTVLNISFSTYINHFRVAYAIDLMKEEYENYTIDYIAQQSGFTNRTTFYRAFKREKGMSPSKYISMCDDEYSQGHSSYY